MTRVNRVTCTAASDGRMPLDLTDPEARKLRSPETRPQLELQAHNGRTGETKTLGTDIGVELENTAPSRRWNIYVAPKTELTVKRLTTLLETAYFTPSEDSPNDIRKRMDFLVETEHVAA